MPIKYKKLPADTTWTTPASGSIKFKRNETDTTWTSATTIKEKSETGSTSWSDTGYIAYPNAPTGFRVTSPGTPGSTSTFTMAFSWTAPVGGATPTKYRLKIFSDLACTTQVGSNIETANGTTYTANATLSVETTYYARIYSVTGSLESLAAGTTNADATKTKLKVVTGKNSYTYPYEVWTDSTTSGIPAHQGQSSTDFNNGTQGFRAYDGDFNTYWSGSSWEWPGGVEWTQFGTSFSSGSGRKLITSVSFINAGNPSGYQRVEELNVFTGTWEEKGSSNSYDTFFGIQVVNTNIEVTSSSFRIVFSNLGYNPTGFGNYRVMISEVRINYKSITTATASVAATSNTVTSV